MSESFIAMSDLQRDQLDKSYREKVKLVDQLNETVKTLETKITRMRQEIQELSDKVSYLVGHFN